MAKQKEVLNRGSRSGGRTEKIIGYVTKVNKEDLTVLSAKLTMSTKQKVSVAELIDEAICDLLDKYHKRGDN